VLPGGGVKTGHTSRNVRTIDVRFRKSVISMCIWAKWPSSLAMSGSNVLAEAKCDSCEALEASWANARTISRFVFFSAAHRSAVELPPPATS
jgi:hypothetical protein